MIGQKMCEYCWYEDECISCGKTSSETELEYELDYWNSTLHGEAVGYWYCKECKNS
jgi:hypothetical protein